MLPLEDYALHCKQRLLQTVINTTTPQQEHSYVFKDERITISETTIPSIYDCSKSGHRTRQTMLQQISSPHHSVDFQKLRKTHCHGNN